MTAEVTLGGLESRGILSIGDGYRTKRSEHGTPGFRILRVADIADGIAALTGPDFVSVDFRRQIGAKLSRPGDVLLTTKGTVGRVARMPSVSETVVYSPQLCFFRVMDDEKLNARFLEFWFRSDRFLEQAAHRSNNTDMAAYINLADIRSLQMELPELGVQRAIAEVLGAFDDKIAANAQLIEAISQLAIAVVSRSPSTVLLSEVVVHHKVMIDPSALPTTEVDLFSLPGFDANGTPERVYPPTIKSGKFLVKGPSVLVSKLNPRFPRLWDVPAPTEVSLASTEFLVLGSRFSSSSVLWAVVSQPSFSTALEAQVSGTSGSHQRVRPADLLATPVVDPRTLGDEVHDLLTSLGERRAVTRAETQTLTATRDALLPLLMSGQVRVKDVERIAESAT